MDFGAGEKETKRWFEQKKLIGECVIYLCCNEIALHAIILKESIFNFLKNNKSFLVTQKLTSFSMKNAGNAGCVRIARYA